MNTLQSRFTLPRGLKRWCVLDGQNRFLVLEAFATLMFARTAIALLPFQAIVKSLGNQSMEPGVSNSSNRGAAASTKIPGVVWSITAVSRHIPWASTCYPKCLAAAWMLRRRKIPYRIYFGLKKVASNGTVELLAHSWVEINERPIFGEQLNHGFTKLICIST